jgi:sulfatase maturation enzyme AslB (radical SAM superfamily)
MSNSLEITTMIGCPLMCTYCPQDKIKLSYDDDSSKYMSLGALKKILSTVPISTEIIFAGYSEPWSNPQCSEFLSYVLKQGYFVSVYTTLYGMTKADTNVVTSMLLKYKNQINEIWLHLPDNHNNMPGWKNTNDWQYAYREFVSRIPSLHFMTLSSSNELHEKITLTKPLADWYLHTRSGNLQVENIHNSDVIAEAHNESPITCTRNKDYHSNVVLPNGDVPLCCMDYSLKHILGNLLYDSYNDILNSEELKTVVKYNREEEFSNKTLCRTCNDTYCVTPYNTDDYYTQYPEHKK